MPHKSLASSPALKGGASARQVLVIGYLERRRRLIREELGFREKWVDRIRELWGRKRIILTKLLTRLYGLYDETETLATVRGSRM